MQYNKPPLTFDQQVNQLISREMNVLDRQKAALQLSHINYFRLAAYWLPFERSDSAHRFEKGTDFDVVLNDYVFDRELRLHLLNAIERIEVSFRTQ